MKRREFITLIAGAAATLPLWTMLPYVARAAPPARSVTIGVIAPLSFPAVEGLRKGFRDISRGGTCGWNIVGPTAPPSDMSALRGNCCSLGWTQSLPGALPQRWARGRPRRRCRSSRRR